MTARDRRGYIVVALVVAFVGAAAVVTGYWFGEKASSTASNAQTASQSGQTNTKLLHTLTKDVQTRNKEIKLLRQEIAKQAQVITNLQNGTKVEDQILNVAGQAVLQLEQQLKNICSANPTCVQVPIPPISVTTTTTTPPHATTTHTTTTTTAPHATTTTATTTTTRPTGGGITTTTTTRPHGHGPPPGKGKH